MAIYYGDGSNSGAGRIVQVKQTVDTGTSSKTGTTPTQIGSLAVAITPKSSSHKLLIQVDLKLGSSGASPEPMIRLLRSVTGGNNDYVYAGAADGSRATVMFGGDEFHANNPPWELIQVAGTYLDSAQNGQSHTYRLYWNRVNTDTLYLNRVHHDNNGAAIPRTASSITVMEISA
jgi:hypothetical protein